MNWASRLTGRLSFSISMVSRSVAFVNGGGKVPAAPLQPPPRTCAIFSMSTSEASCHGRELSRAVTRRELTAEALRRPGKALRCFPSFFPGCRPVRARARSKLFCKKVSSKNFTLASLGALFSLLPSTCESPPKTPGHTFAAWPGPRRARPAAPPASGAGRPPWPPRWRWRR